MAEYIEREALFKKALEERRFVFQREDLINAEIVVKTVYSDFAEFVNSIPAADVVEVVRCKDCRRSLESEGYLVCDHALPTKSIDQYFTVGTDILAIVKPYDFCSYGERRNT